MPTPQAVREEEFAWRVRYTDDTFLWEWDACPETGGSHVWACVDLSRVAAVSLIARECGCAVGTVETAGKVPLFFRRRFHLVNLSGGSRKALPSITYFGVEGEMYEADSSGIRANGGY